MDANTLISHIEETAPLKFAADWDNSGIQVAGTRAEISKLACFLDPTPQSVRQALDWGADFLLCHHPLAMAPRLPDRIDDFHRVLGSVMTQGSWLYAAHTSLDARLNGPASWLAQDLELNDCACLEPTGGFTSKQIIFSTDKPEAEVKKILTQHGSVIDFGSLGKNTYRAVCWDTQWPELKTMLKSSLQIRQPIHGVEQSFPAATGGIGQVGNLPHALPWKKFAAQLHTALNNVPWTVAGREPETVRKIAVCPGSGGSLLHQAARFGVEVYITGELKHHQALECESLGLFVIDVGHFVLEERMMKVWADQLHSELSPSGMKVRFIPGSVPLRPYDPENINT